MSLPCPGALIQRDRRWESDQLLARAQAWGHAASRWTLDPAAPVAVVLSNTLEAIAAFLGASTLPNPVVLLPPDPRGWATRPPLPAGMAAILAPGQEDVGGAAIEAGLRPLRLEEPSGRASPGERALLQCAGVVSLTSGSTGSPRPVHRTSAGLVLEARAIARAMRLEPGDGIIGTLALSNLHGFVNVLILAAILESEIALLPEFKSRSVLDLFAAGRHRFWAGTPFMADMLARAALPARPSSGPAVCKVSGGELHERTFVSFLERFGVPLRTAYGNSENGVITADMDVPVRWRPQAVGQPVPGVELAVGDEPGDASRPSGPGRIWLRSPWYMTGYGFPPTVEAPMSRDGWWPTADVGRLDADDRLTLYGRLDECFKTAAGHLVHPGAVADAFLAHPDVVEAVVLPVPGPLGPTVGAVVEVSGVTPGMLRAEVAQRLPAWLHPQVLVVTAALPRLPGGKPDRLTCATLLASQAPGEVA